ncbi:signal peptidase II [Peptococcus simiae]|uniref:signal peptidase II n=1 Tax=Peptococcus simiae TaxID=1643805 RepID=UPI00397F68E4
MKFWAAVLALVGLDQVTKWVIRQNLALGESIPVIPSIMSLTYIENPGAAFGILAGNRLLFIVLTLALLTLLVLYQFHAVKSSRLLDGATALIIAGAFGNLIDRLVKGQVTDFFDFHFFPIFNIADIAVTCGVGLMVVYILKDESDTRPS